MFVRSPWRPVEGGAARIDAASAALKRIASRHAPKTGSVWVRLMLGRVNVKSVREDDRLLRKNEYEKFRSRTNLVFLALVLVRAACYFAVPVASASSLAVDIAETVSLVWLLYYYTTLALRENILRVNGSAIADWWITHHYLSGTLTVVYLAWPKSDPVYDAFRPIMLVLSAIQAVTQILVTRYQSGRLYRLVAMGKASRLDVTGESNTEWVGAGWTPSAAAPPAIPPRRTVLPALCFLLALLYPRRAPPCRRADSLALGRRRRHLPHARLWQSLLDAARLCAESVWQRWQAQERRRLHDAARERRVNCCMLRQKLCLHFRSSSLRHTHSTRAFAASL
jgi:hypothetical protein